ncbi:MAG: FAD-dependent oxidoreductase [Candidatus Marinimicrobia bacterium]|nr:FAD-dependent oxidoreductase [Candidatus Neomarinimicrobiota bacterium]
MSTLIKTDIAIVGAGIAGICSAVSAAREGCKVVLIESFSYVGGLATGGMVSPFMKHEVRGKSLVEGIFKELKDRIRADGGLIDNGFSADVFRDTATIMLSEAGVDLYLNSKLIEVERDTTKIKELTVIKENVTIKIQAEQFIDTSGDAVLAFLSDAPYEISDEQQAMTLFFKMKNIDLKNAIDYVKNNPDDFFPWSTKAYDPAHIASVAGYYSFIKKAQAQGSLSDAVQYIFFSTLPEPGTASFNCVNLLGFDGTKAKDLEDAYLEGRTQIADIVKILKNIPGFVKARLAKIADRVGVRETRRVIGDYVMTADDIRQGRKFKDAIAKACYGIDIHGQKEDESIMEELPEGEYYEIPKQTLFVKSVLNLQAAGRCISSTREGQAALRIMPTCAATGEAAGKIAAKAINTNKTIREV